MKTVPIALCIALVAAFPAHAQRPINPRPPQPAETPELPKGAWVEFEVELPEYPVADRLVEFNASVNQRNHSFIDPKTLALGDDGVVRYAMVIKVKDGVDNVTYEGIRCDSKEFKVYAVGDAGSRWIKATNAKWLTGEMTSCGSRSIPNVSRLALMVQFDPLPVVPPGTLTFAR